MLFDHGNLTRISVRINSIQYPEALANGIYARAYTMFLEAVNKYQDDDSGTQISAEDWASMCPSYHFDVSKHSEQEAH